MIPVENHVTHFTTAAWSCGTDEAKQLAHGHGQSLMKHCVRCSSQKLQACDFVISALPKNI